MVTSAGIEGKTSDVQKSVACHSFILSYFCVKFLYFHFFKQYYIFYYAFTVILHLNKYLNTYIPNEELCVCFLIFLLNVFFDTAVESQSTPTSISPKQCISVTAWRFSWLFQLDCYSPISLLKYIWFSMRPNVFWIVVLRWIAFSDGDVLNRTVGDNNWIIVEMMNSLIVNLEYVPLLSAWYCYVEDCEIYHIVYFKKLPSVVCRK